MIHQQRISLHLGVYQANAWSAPIGYSDSSSRFPLLPLVEKDNASLLRIGADGQSDSDICSEPRGVQRQRLGVFPLQPYSRRDRTANNASCTVWIDSTDLFVIIVVFLFGSVLQLGTMTALSLLLMAVSAATVLAESSVYLREQFEDGGEVLLHRIIPSLFDCCCDLLKLYIYQILQY